MPAICTLRPLQRTCTQITLRHHLQPSTFSLSLPSCVPPPPPSPVPTRLLLGQKQRGTLSSKGRHVRDWAHCVFKARLFHRQRPPPCVTLAPPILLRGSSYFVPGLCDRVLLCSFGTEAGSSKPDLAIRVYHVRLPAVCLARFPPSL